MSNIERHKKDYLERNCIDCPYCSRDFPEHSCTNCYSEMDKETCWKYEGYCSLDCKMHIEHGLPALRQEKEKLGIKCQCDEPNCAKCLLSNCKNDNCPTHLLQKKLEFREKYSKK